MSGRSHDLIVERALLGSIAALLPIPFVDDFLLGRSRRVLFTAIAATRGLRISEPVMSVLTARPEEKVMHVGLALALRALPGAMRIGSRVAAALETFRLATLVDHYAHTHHQGLDLDGKSARALRDAMDRAVLAVPRRVQPWRDARAYADELRAAFDQSWAKALP